MRAAARRIALLVAVVLGITAGVSALVGLLAGAPLARAVSVGLYLVGSFLIVLGFFSGVRGPVRPKGRQEGARPLGFGGGMFAAGVRTATADERADARAITWLFLALGVALVVVGVLVDARVGFT